MSARSLSSACGEQSDGMGQRDRQTSVMSALSGTVTVIFSFDCGGAMGFLKSVIQYADDISFFSSTNGYEIVLALDFYTYALYRHGRKMRP